MESVLVVMRCVHCLGVHRLAYPNPEEIFKKQLLKPVAACRADFCCKHCWLVFPYKAEDACFERVQMLDQNQIRADAIGYRITFRCGHENCKASVIVHTTRDAETSNRELKFRADSRKVAAACQLNHTPTLIDSNTELLISEVGGFEIAHVS